MRQKQEQLLYEIEKYLDYLVVVEGKRDKAALERLGFKNIFILNSDGKSMGEKIEEIEKEAKNREISILTDFDVKGRKLFEKLNSELSQRNVKLDRKLRSRLKKEVTFIEDL